ncbi:putative leader peptide [Streptomyces aureus]|uniref:Leader peptide n=1 Tax=Streptomyces aureus TaxID=193461 RepID=A0ABV4SU46_9ACTN
MHTADPHFQSTLVERLHVDLARQSSALCRSPR